MRARADLEVVCRGRKLQVREEDICHLRVVMLTRMNDDFVNPCELPERTGDRSRLDELRTCSDDANDLHPTCSTLCSGGERRLAKGLKGPDCSRSSAASHIHTKGLGSRRYTISAAGPRNSTPPRSSLTRSEARGDVGSQHRYVSEHRKVYS